MRQISQSYKTGELALVEVAEPRVRSATILVDSCASLLSAGTERTMVELGRKSLLGKARERPDLVKKVIGKARREGAIAALEAVRSRLDSPVPLGYSLSGRVIAVGAGIDEFACGDRVACAGAGYANHAEVNVVPRNLAVPVPDQVSDEEAAFVTVGAIALHGVRLVRPTLGAVVAVIGLGLLGQIAVQLLNAHGCSVVGIDIDPSRVELAKSRGAVAGVVSGRDDALEVVRAVTRGRGVDAVLITASANTNQPLVQAGDICRDRGTVSVVGLLPLEVPRKAYFEKELQVVVSRSYGPGRYDPAYEERGHDYPIGYVRWSERRNMEAVIDAIAQKRLDVASLVTHRFPFDRALDAYDLITAEPPKPHLGVILTYAEHRAPPPSGVKQAPSKRSSRLGIGVLGTGAFATSTLLPKLAEEPQARLVAMSSARGLSARHAAARFGARACSDLSEMLAAPDVDVIAIATRHSAHAAQAAEALRAGRDVFLEKPAAIDEEQLAVLEQAVRESPGRLLVGFNRRFAPFARKVSAEFAGRKTGLVMHARVNAGAIAGTHWIADTAESGGRIIGEVCHFVDLLSYWSGSAPARVSASAIGAAGGASRADNVAIVLEFRDGSVGTITYTSMGDGGVGKERYEVFCEGAVAVIDDWRSLTLHAGGKRTTTRGFRTDKGHSAELKEFLAACASGAPSPISWESISATTRATFAAELAWRNRSSVELG